MEKLLKFISENSDKDVARLILDRKKHPEIDMDLAINCIESRRKLKGKVQEWYDNPELIFPLKPTRLFWGIQPFSKCVNIITLPKINGTSQYSRIF